MGVGESIGGKIWRSAELFKDRDAFCSLSGYFCSFGAPL